MHYEINYKNLTKRQAVVDAYSYCPKNARKIVRACYHREVYYPYFCFLWEFAGICGFPVRAIWDRLVEKKWLIPHEQEP